MSLLSAWLYSECGAVDDLRVLLPATARTEEGTTVHLIIDVNGYFE